MQGDYFMLASDRRALRLLRFFQLYQARIEIAAGVTALLAAGIAMLATPKM
jgi:hypothetical protein